jgi:hypothetical protein
MSADQIIKSLHDTICDEMNQTCDRLGIIKLYDFDVNQDYERSCNLTVYCKDIEYIANQYGLNSNIKTIENDPFLYSDRIITLGTNKERENENGNICSRWSVILITDRLQKAFLLSSGSMEENKKILALELRFMLCAFRLITTTNNTPSDIMNEFRNLNKFMLIQDNIFEGWFKDNIASINDMSDDDFYKLTERFFGMMSNIYEKSKYASLFTYNDFMELYNLRARARWWY